MFKIKNTYLEHNLDAQTNKLNNTNLKIKQRSSFDLDLF